MGTSSREPIIQELIAEGNDEQVVRLIDAIWDLEPERLNERLDLQMRLGRRYLALALSQASGAPDEDVEVLLVRWFEQDIPSGVEGHRMIPEWYAEAEKLFSAVLERASLPQTKASSLAHRGLVHMLRGANDLALAELDQAIAFSPLFPEFSYWRGLILVKLDAREEARTALTMAYEQKPENERYRRAYLRVIGSVDR
ncbi:MAG TPA: hypothetical protein VFV38_10630 [Ktedonobacteraceae bacterium]|nr:hypothetical protein [Ktedonobacteraceae bacterium]